MVVESGPENYDGEVFMYYGDIAREGYNKISEAYEKAENKKDKVCLVLVTYGGDPDAAYRIARATHHHFSTVEVLIPDICKSAGTLLCIGAQRLIFGDRGELGPLDIQLSKPDEMFENMSGLDIIQAINALQNQVLESFRTYLFDIRTGSRIRTKTAAELAISLADGFVAPIAARIDPLTLGSHQRAMQIAYDYGERLGKMADSLKPNALVRLVSTYPSHGFVIDRKEAGELFNQVVAPEGATLSIYNWAREVITAYQYPFGNSPCVHNIREAIMTNISAQEACYEGGNTNDQRLKSKSSEANASARNKSEDHEPDVSQSSKSGNGSGNSKRKRAYKATGDE
ncbi:SppA protein [Hahella sp. KA22]|uniref:SDH family Clp fold serine proteinase n=1 Tax=Hahella sp. KA22 TaxID=1628392 RepID=UPI000FDF17FE|nr:SppA protein [Hahella sp. KA22]AZZ94667.1 SppA protein [Hahella sp. KA22]QAY58040.1 SppA protein [Hahella sp. KA22]